MQQYSLEFVGSYVCVTKWGLLTLLRPSKVNSTGGLELDALKLGRKNWHKVEIGG